MWRRHPQRHQSGFVWCMGVGCLFLGQLAAGVGTRAPAVGQVGAQRGSFFKAVSTKQQVTQADSDPEAQDRGPSFDWGVLQGLVRGLWQKERASCCSSSVGSSQKQARPEPALLYPGRNGQTGCWTQQKEAEGEHGWTGASGHFKRTWDWPLDAKPPGNEKEKRRPENSCSGKRWTQWCLCSWSTQKRADETGHGLPA